MYYFGMLLSGRCLPVQVLPAFCCAAGQLKRKPAPLPPCLLGDQGLLWLVCCLLGDQVLLGVLGGSALLLNLGRITFRFPVNRPDRLCEDLGAGMSVEFMGLSCSRGFRRRKQCQKMEPNTESS